MVYVVHMATDTRIPLVASSSWGATITQHIVLKDGRVVNLHYALNSYMAEAAPYVLTSVSVHLPGTDLYTENFSLAPLASLTYADPKFVPDVLPEWLRYLVQNFPTPAPITKD